MIQTAKTAPAPVHQDEEDTVRFDIHHSDGVHTGGVGGYFFNIPAEDDEEVDEGFVRLRGPYPTVEAAVEAAREFVADAIGEEYLDCSDEEFEFEADEEEDEELI